MTDLLSTIDVETAPNPEFAVILMHGLGADANDFMPLVPELRLGDAPAVRFVFPNAPEMPVTANNGYVMRAWYDILSFQRHESASRRSGYRVVLRNRAAIDRAQNRRGIPTSKIFLAGFSQGGGDDLFSGPDAP